MRGWGPIGGLLIASNMHHGWLGRTELLCGEDQRQDVASDGVEAAQLAALGYCQRSDEGRPAGGWGARGAAVGAGEQRKSSKRMARGGRLCMPCMISATAGTARECCAWVLGSCGVGCVRRLRLVTPSSGMSVPPHRRTTGPRQRNMAALRITRCGTRGEGAQHHRRRLPRWRPMLGATPSAPCVRRPRMPRQLQQSRRDDACETGPERRATRADADAGCAAFRAPPRASLPAS